MVSPFSFGSAMMCIARADDSCHDIECHAGCDAKLGDRAEAGFKAGMMRAILVQNTSIQHKKAARGAFAPCRRRAPSL
jgi:hypothetical protein